MSATVTDAILLIFAADYNELIDCKVLSPNKTTEEIKGEIFSVFETCNDFSTCDVQHWSFKDGELKHFSEFYVRGDFEL